MIKNKVKYSGSVLRKKIKGKEIIILGTAHVSEKSVQDVENLIHNEKPDVISVELCQTRYQNIKRKNQWVHLDIIQIIKQKKIFLLMSSLILAAFQKKIGNIAKVRPGEEMFKAIQLASKTKTKLELVDRDVQITLKRVWQNAGYWGKLMMFSELLTSLLVSIKTDVDEIEKMKKGDVVDQVFQNLPYQYNLIKRVIIEERDQYIAHKIKEASAKMPPKSKMVIILGAGHLKGVHEALKEEVDIQKLEHLKKSSKFISTIRFFTPIILIMGIFFYFTGIDDPQKIYQSWIAWCLIKASCSGSMALLLLAHPLSILAAAIVAPISNFNPILKPGWMAALVEAKFRKPKVIDFENFSNDVSTFKGVIKNKVSRIFSIFILPQLGSSLGTAIALWYIAH